MNKPFLLMNLFILLGAPLLAQKTPEPILLWPDGAPGAVGNEPVDQPTIQVYPAPPETAARTAVVVCPGGGYAHLAMDHEGDQIARWLNSFGVSAVVLKYRLGMRYHHPAPLQDVQRAIRLTRSQAQEWGFTAERVGVIGFSAGGHLASSSGTHFEPGHSDSTDPVERVSSRPDFMILVYPVISLTTEYTHQGSKRNLLGESPEPSIVELMSNELQVADQTPPAFLVHSTDDRVVPPENSVLFYLALRRAGVPAEMHIYLHGGHGYGLGRTDAILSSWPERCRDWMMKNGWLR